MSKTYLCEKCGATLEAAESFKLMWLGGHLIGVYCDECKEKITRVVEEENIQ